MPAPAEVEDFEKAGGPLGNVDFRQGAATLPCGGEESCGVHELMRTADSYLQA